ncbi:MAG: dehydrogenase [Pirellulaceae bacterium]|nr:MAG: dehydrogenase [Pirellulaceae bacterium]
MTKLTIAFLGIDHPHGAAWRELLRHFQDKLQIVALVPGLQGTTSSLEERFADLPMFPTVEELVRWGEFDAAIVCLSSQETPAAATQLARAGKHLLVEKPGARTAQEWQPVIEAVQSQKVAFQSGYLWRYDEAVERLRKMREHGRFGRLISVEMLYVTSDIRRRGADHYLFDREVSGGGFFHWLACHYLDLLLYVVNEPVVGVTARLDVFGGTPVDVEDGGAVLLDLKSGALVSLVGGYWLPRWTGEAQWTIRGSERWVHWKPQAGAGLLEIHGPQPHWYAMEETFRLPEDTTSGYGGYRGIRLVDDWLNAISEKRPCRNTPRSTGATLSLLDTIYQAAQTGRRVECHIEPSL